MASALRTRSITGIIFAIVVISLLKQSNTTATILLAAIAILASYEYGRLVYGESRLMQIVTVIASAVIPVFLIPKLKFAGNTYQILLGLSLLFSLYSLANLYTKENILPHRKLGVLVSALYIGLPIGLFVSLINSSSKYNYLLPLGIVMLIWMSDSMAYLVGSQIGKTKLFPSVSPNKTWEGTLGAGLFTLLFAYGLCHWSKDFSLTFWIITGLTVWIFGTYGDLVESQLKRYYKVKDSGNILPGHGGFLDRFDSFIFVLPFVTLIYLYFQH